MDITRCTRCNEPAHASESNDEGVCLDCLARDVHQHKGDAFIAHAHAFVSHAGDACDGDGCDAAADPLMVDALYRTAGEVLK